jgi:hypothetical protein
MRAAVTTAGRCYSDMSIYLHNVALAALAVVMVSCAGSAHPRPLNASEALAAPRAIELYSPVRAATLHFPSGLYVLEASDAIGYYYRAPGAIIQHTAAGAAAQRGGLFVSKRNRNKVRGYVYLAGAVTHVGNFSRSPHAFRN